MCLISVLVQAVLEPHDDWIDLDSEGQDDTGHLRLCNLAERFEEECLEVFSVVESLEDVVLAVSLDPAVLEEFVRRIVVEIVH